LAICACGERRTRMERRVLARRLGCAALRARAIEAALVAAAVGALPQFTPALAMRSSPGSVTLAALAVSPGIS